MKRQRKEKTKGSYRETRASFHQMRISRKLTLQQRCVLRRWWSWIQEKNFSTKSMNLLVHRKESYWNRLLHDGRQDTASIEERASNAHSRQCRETCSGKIDYRIQGLPYHTVQQEDHIRKEAVKSWFINRKRIQIERRWTPTWGKITRTTHSAKIRTTWSAAWETWSTPRCVKYLLKFSSLIVWHTGRKGIAYCICGTCLCLTDKSRKLNRDRFHALSILWFIIDSKLRDKARSISRRTSWKYWKTKNLSRS